MACSADASAPGRLTLLHLAIALRIFETAMVGSQTLAYDVELCLAEDFQSVAQARQFTGEMVARWTYRGRHDDVVLVVSELVANALRHGQGAPTLRLTGTAWRLRIEVTDNSPVLPAVRRSSSEGGWGLKLVERLAAGWGAFHRASGKVVWCELAPAPTPTVVAQVATV
jgi:anti-sigma regulatory factor (Ser/Thr protein kinase)